MALLSLDLCVRDFGRLSRCAHTCVCDLLAPLCLQIVQLLDEACKQVRPPFHRTTSKRWLQKHTGSASGGHRWRKSHESASCWLLGTHRGAAPRSPSARRNVTAHARHSMRAAALLACPQKGCGQGRGCGAAAPGHPQHHHYRTTHTRRHYTRCSLLQVVPVLLWLYERASSPPPPQRGGLPAPADELAQHGQARARGQRLRLLTTPAQPRQAGCAGAAAATHRAQRAAPRLPPAAAVHQLAAGGARGRPCRAPTPRAAANTRGRRLPLLLPPALQLCRPAA
jgi:hypothetical protein